MIKVREMHLEKSQGTVIVTTIIKNLTAAHLCLMRIKIMDYASTIVAFITVSHHATGGTSKFLVIIATILDIVSGISLYITQITSRRGIKRSNPAITNSPSLLNSLPYIFDSHNKIQFLVDSGASISLIPTRPEDKKKIKTKN